MKVIIIIVLNILTIVSLFPQQDQKQDMFRLAQAFEQQGDFERALQVYSDLYSSDTSNYVYFDALRRINVQLKNYDAAIQISSRRLRITPYDVNLKSAIGGLYAISGNVHSADSIWNTILLTANKSQMVYRVVANEQSNQRLFDRSIETYRRGRKEIGDQYLFANELGYLYSFTMDFKNSTREYLLMMAQNQQQFDFVQSRLSSIVTRQDGLSSATSVVEEEVKAHQSIPLLRLQIWLYLEGKRFTEALTVAETLEKLVNSNGQELFSFAERVFRENEFRIASVAYQQALKSSSRSQFIPAARFGFARCIEELSLRGESIEAIGSKNTSTLESQPSFSGAINLYADLAKEFPYSNVGSNALYRIGWIRYKQLFDLDGALTVFDSVLAVSPAGPMVPNVLLTIGDIYVAQNKLKKATVKYSSMALSPYSNADQRTMAQYRLSEIQFFQNNFDSTLSLLKPLTENLKADESNDALLLQFFVTENKLQFSPALQQFAHAELLARQFKLSEAIEEFASIIDLYPATPLADDALLRIAAYNIELKNFNNALAAYRELLRDYKESIEKDKTQFKIGELYQFYLVDKEKAIAAYEEILEKYPYSLFTEEARKRVRQLRGDSI